MEEKKFFVIEQKALAQLATLVSQVPWNMADPIMKLIETSFKEVKVDSTTPVEPPAEPKVPLVDESPVNNSN